MSARKALLVCEGLALFARDSVAFANFSASFLDGSLTIIHSSSGLGTSSLLRMMAGLREPDLGKITRGSDDVAFLDGRLLALDDDVTVLGNLMFWAKLRHDPAVVPIAIEHFSLYNVKNELCKYLSFGEKKRVALARLMVLRSIIWILDHPFEHLDDDGTDMLISAIMGRINSGGLVICSAGIERNLEFFSQTSKINIDDFQSE